MNKENEITVGIADVKVGKAPSILKTSLGSCIAVCLYEPDKKVGGMLHCMLASSAGTDKTKPGFKKAKYADTGMECLIGMIKDNFQVSEKNLKAKIFGGAKILKNISKNIGLENAEAVRRILKSYGIKIIAEKVGGDKGYKILFNLENGRVIVQIFGEKEEVY